MWEMWYRNASIAIYPHTHTRWHTHSLARTHRYNLCLWERSNFSWVLPHTTVGATPSPHTHSPPSEPYKSNLVSCVACQVWGQVAAREMEKQTQFPSLGRSPAKWNLLRHATCYVPPSTLTPSSSSPSLCPGKTKKRARLRNKSYLRAHTLATMAVLLHSPQAQPHPQPRLATASQSKA